MHRVEFHCHTIFSKDSLTRPAVLVDTCRKKGIDRVVITDHNEVQGALEAKKIDPQRVIVGEEILTTQGEILGFYVQEKIPRGLPPLEVIRRLREQGAFISVPHPLDHYRGWKADDLLEILPLIDAIEVFNARCIHQADNQRATDLAHQYDLASTVGSDAHAPFELGNATLTLPPFENASDLRKVIREGQPNVTRAGIKANLASRYAVLHKMLFKPTY